MVNVDFIGGCGNGCLCISNFVKYGLYEKGDICNFNYNICCVMWYNKFGFLKEVGIDVKGFLVDKDKGIRNVILKMGDQVIFYEGDLLNVFYFYFIKWGVYDEIDDFGYVVVKDWFVMCLGEIYLFCVEVCFCQGNIQGVVDDINVLCDCVFKDYCVVVLGVGKVMVDQIDIDFILDECVCELISEENCCMILVWINMLVECIKLNGDMEFVVLSNKVIIGFDVNIYILFLIFFIEI